jgi:hypothetical protein
MRHMRFSQRCCWTFNVFWDVKPCRLVTSYRHFGRSYCLHLQGQKLQENSLAHRDDGAVRSLETSPSTCQSAWYGLTRPDPSPQRWFVPNTVGMSFDSFQDCTDKCSLQVLCNILITFVIRQSLSCRRWCISTFSALRICSSFAFSFPIHIKTQVRLSAYRIFIIFTFGISLCSYRLYPYRQMTAQTNHCWAKQTVTNEGCRDLTLHTRLQTPP